MIYMFFFFNIGIGIGAFLGGVCITVVVVLVIMSVKKLRQKRAKKAKLPLEETKAKLTHSSITHSQVPLITVPDSSSIVIQIILPASLPTICTVLTHLKSALPESSPPQIGHYHSLLIISVTVKGAVSKLLPNKSITSTTTDSFTPFKLLHDMFSRLLKLNVDEIPIVAIQSVTRQTSLVKKPEAISPVAAEDSGLDVNSM